MPTIYLSPSTREHNLLPTGNSEEYYANLVTDAMIPYLHACGIGFIRNDPGCSISDSIGNSNAANADFHLAIHTCAAPPNLTGLLRGPEIFYPADCIRSKGCARLLADNLALIYPYPELIAAVPTTTLPELCDTNAPAIQANLIYRDNQEDAAWLTSHIDAIGESLALFAADIFDLPFMEP